MPSQTQQDFDRVMQILLGRQRRKLEPTIRRLAARLRVQVADDLFKDRRLGNKFTGPRPITEISVLVRGTGEVMEMAIEKVEKLVARSWRSIKADKTFSGANPCYDTELGFVELIWKNNRVTKSKS